MNQFILISAGSTKAVLPLLALLFKGSLFGAKKHGLKKAIVKEAKEEAKDKIKEKLQKKKDNDKD